MMKVWQDQKIRKQLPWQRQIYHHRSEEEGAAAAWEAPGTGGPGAGEEQRQRSSGRSCYCGFHRGEQVRRSQQA